MTGLVDGLGGGVVLGVDPRCGGGDVSRHHEGALFAVQKLAELKALHLDADPHPLFLAEVLEWRAGQPLEHLEALHRELHEAPGDLFGVDVDAPVEVGGAVPLGGLGLFVQLGQRRPGAFVVPGEPGVCVQFNRAANVVGPTLVVVGGQDVVDVVDVRGPCGEVVVGRPAWRDGGGHGVSPEIV